MPKYTKGEHSVRTENKREGVRLRAAGYRVDDATASTQPQPKPQPQPRPKAEAGDSK